MRKAFVSKTNYVVIDDALDIFKITDKELVIHQRGLEKAIHVSDDSIIQQVEDFFFKKDNEHISESTANTIQSDVILTKSKIQRIEVALFYDREKKYNMPLIYLARIENENHEIAYGISIVSLSDLSTSKIDTGVRIALKYAYKALEQEKNVSPFHNTKNSLLVSEDDCNLIESKSINLTDWSLLLEKCKAKGVYASVLKLHYLESMWDSAEQSQNVFQIERRVNHDVQSKIEELRKKIKHLKCDLRRYNNKVYILVRDGYYFSNKGRNVYVKKEECLCENGLHVDSLLNYYQKRKTQKDEDRDQETNN